MDEEHGPRRIVGRSRLRTTLVLGGLVVLAVGAAVVGGVRVAALHAPSTTPYIAPADRHPAWLIKNPVLAGKVVHWTQYQVISSPGMSDPANGKLLIGDIWEQLGATGDPVFEYSRWTYADGTFHQEVYATTQDYIIVQGNDYRATSPHPSPPVYPTPTNWCVTKQATPPKWLADATPEFVNEGAFPAAGYTRSQGRLDRPEPATPSLPGVSAIDVYRIPAVAHQWKYRFINRLGNVSTTTISVDARGRIVLWESHYTDAYNQTIGSDTWFAYGDMVVYGSLAGVPQSVLSVPPQVTKGCH